MSAADYSKYLQFELTSADGSKTIDISAGIGGDFMFYEDIFSPVVTAKVLVMDAGKNSINGKKYNEALYAGLPIVGGETAKIQIRNQSNQILDLQSMICFKPGDLNTKDNVEVFTLSFISKEYFNNENHRIARKLKEKPTHEHVQDILNTEFKTKKQLSYDPATSNFSYQGNNRKPFTVIMHMAVKTVGDKPEQSSGYVFYETRRGYNFRSLDKLSAQPPGKPYLLSGQMQSQYDPQGVDVDRKILRYQELQSKNLIQKSQYGAFSAKRYTFNAFNASIEDGKTDFDWEKATDIDLLGKDRYQPPEGLFDNATRFYVALQDNQSLTDTDKLNVDFSDSIAQSPFRYNALFTQVLNITVPSNFDLHAGDVIAVEIPKVGCNYEVDENLSGKYLIKEVCHHITESRSYSHLKLIRDTRGRKSN